MVYNTRSASKANGSGPYNTRSSTLASKDVSSNGKTRKTPSRISNGTRKTKSVAQSKAKRNLKTSNKDGINKVASYNTRSSSSSTNKKKKTRTSPSANSKKRNTRNSKKPVETSQNSLTVSNSGPSPQLSPIATSNTVISSNTASPVDGEASASKRARKSKNPIDHTMNPPTKRTRAPVTDSIAEEPKKRVTRSAHSTK